MCTEKWRGRFHQSEVSQLSLSDSRWKWLQMWMNQDFGLIFENSVFFAVGNLFGTFLQLNSRFNKTCFSNMSTIVDHLLIHFSCSDGVGKKLSESVLVNKQLVLIRYRPLLHSLTQVVMTTDLCVCCYLAVWPMAM